ncbi:MAG: FtsX-like permease family protein [Phycisphaerales bacterium]
MGSIRAVWPFVRLSLLGRPRRTTLLAIAVALSTALVVAVVSLVHSGQAGIERRIVRSIGATDAVVSHQFGSDFEESLLEEVRGWTGVAFAGGRLRGAITIVRADGRRDEEGRIRRTTTEVRGVDLSDIERFDQLELEAGRLPAAPGEIVIDPLVAEQLEAVVGDRLEVQRFGDPIELEIVGIQRRPILGALQRPIAHLDRVTLAEAMNAASRLTAISLIPYEGVDVPAWCEDRQLLLGEGDLVVEPSERIRGGFDRTIAGSRLGLSLGAAMAFLSCSFIVATGMTTAVVEQQRLLAIARCLGASRRQVFLGQLVSGASLGAIGGLLGLPIGVAVAAIGAAFIPEVLTAGLQIPLWGVALAVVGSGGTGLLGASYPAFQASRVPPLEAMRVRARPVRPWAMVLCAAGGFAAIAVQVALLSIGDRDQRYLVYSFVGMPLLHVGWFLLSPPLFLIVSRLLANPLGRLLRLPPRLLESSVAATPYRLGFTAGALMLGLSILVSTWSNGVSVENVLRDRVRFADGFVFRTSGLSPEQQARIAALPGVVESCPVGYLPLEVIGQQVFGIEGLAPPNVIAVGFDPVRFLRLNRLEWIRGDPESAIPRLLAGDACLVAEPFLTARGLGVGDSIELGNARRSATFEIVGVVGAAGLDMATQMFGMRSLYNEQAISCVFLDFGAVTRNFGSREAFIMQLSLDESLGADGERRLQEAIVDAVPGTVFTTGRGIREVVDRVGGTVLAVAGAVSAGALLLAGLGVGNVIAAGIAARRFEFGLMRAVGASRGLVARLVAAEAMLIATTAAIAGATLGMRLAWMGGSMYRDLAGLRLAWNLPLAPLALGCAALLLVALVASAPAALGLLRRPTVELLAGGRAG